MKIVNTIRNALLRTIKSLNGIVMVGMFAILLAQVLMRKFLQNPLSWPEETSLVALVWLTFMGAYQITLQGTHLKMDLFEGKLKGRMGDLLSIVSKVLVLLFLVLTIYFGIPFIEQAGNTRMPITKIPMFIPYYIILFSFVLMSLEYLTQILLDIKKLMSREERECSQS